LIHCPTIMRKFLVEGYAPLPCSCGVILMHDSPYQGETILKMSLLACLF
jgi:hypothetical protein